MKRLLSIKGGYSCFGRSHNRGHLRNHRSDRLLKPSVRRHHKSVGIPDKSEGEIRRPNSFSDDTLDLKCGGVLEKTKPLFVSNVHLLAKQGATKSDVIPSQERIQSPSDGGSGRLEDVNKNKLAAVGNNHALLVLCFRCLREDWRSTFIARPLHSQWQAPPVKPTRTRAKSHQPLQQKYGVAQWSSSPMAEGANIAWHRSRRGAGNSN